MPRSHLDSRADADSVAAASAWTLPGQRHPAPSATVQQVDLATLHPLAHRMGEALGLLRQFVEPADGISDIGLRRMMTVAGERRVIAARALLRDAGLLPPA